MLSSFIVIVSCLHHEGATHTADQHSGAAKNKQPNAGIF